MINRRGLLGGVLGTLLFAAPLLSFAAARVVPSPSSAQDTSPQRDGQRDFDSRSAAQWTLHYASSRDGSLAPPVIGSFANGRGEFYGQDTLNGRAILVRFVISEITASSCRFEQGFSADGGRNWEVNWIAVDTRVR